MHLGNGAITPECGAVALGVAAMGVGTAFVATRLAGVPPRRAYTAAALGSAVFAAQLFNVQILPFSSVHLIGGVLLAWVLSPALGALTMTGILALQTVLLGDGGLLALGANVINMGLMPAAAVALVRRGTRRQQAQSKQAQSKQAQSNEAESGWVLAATAFGATVVAAALIVLEVSIGRSPQQLQGLQYFAVRLLAWHALAGVAEAGMTVAIVAVLAKLAARDATGLELPVRSAGWVVAASLAIAVLSLPTFGLASAIPDSYQAALFAADQVGLAVGKIETPTRLASAAVLVQAVQDRLAAALPHREGPLVVLATILAGVIAGGIAWTGRQGQSDKPLTGCT